MKTLSSWSIRIFTAAFLLASVSLVRGEDPDVLVRGTLLAPKAFRAAAARVQPGLVRIEGLGGIAPGVDGGGYQAPGEGPTTGVVISADGYIVTSTFNFLRKPPIITVIGPDGQRRVAELLGRDETRKLCLLKVSGDVEWQVPPLAPRSELQVGQWAVAVGFGFGATEPSLSAGIISATSRISQRAVQTDTNLSPANYGGPLIDLEGRVIGICVPLSPQSKTEAAGAEWYDSGIGFAVPLDGLDATIAAMKAGKTLQPGFLGVQTAPFGDPPRGAEIKQLVPDSPAAKAGLAAGDQILRICETEIIDGAQLSTVIGRYYAGDKIMVVVKRGDEEKSLEAELVVPPPPPKPGPPMPLAVPMPGEKPGAPPMPKPDAPPGEESPPEKPAPDQPAPDGSGPTSRANEATKTERKFPR
jgi:serine protease Do